jgi:hypothetical protein
MARRVFFSFHFERDITRANVVRNSWVTQDREEAGFFDASLWEDAKTKGDDAVHALIKKGLDGTTVTAVLIGAETAGRKYVEYEIIESYNRGNGLIGVYIHQIKDLRGGTDVRGTNPFASIYVTRNGQKVYFTDIYPTYDWVDNSGYANLGTWVEQAAKAAGK